MDLILVRHAEPARVAGGSGQAADPGLTERGREQARRLSSWLAHEHVDAVVTSPQRRATETAAPLADRLGREARVVDGLREYDWRADEYIPIEELRARRDPRWSAMAEGRWAGTGADDPEEFAARVHAAIDDVVAAHPGGRVVVVCHGGVVNVVLGAVLALARPLWFAPDYASIHRLVAARTGVRSIVSVNETAHLEAGRRTPAP